MAKGKIGKGAHRARDDGDGAHNFTGKPSGTNRSKGSAKRGKKVPKLGVGRSPRGASGSDGFSHDSRR